MPRALKKPPFKSPSGDNLLSRGSPQINADCSPRFVHYQNKKISYVGTKVKSFAQRRERIPDQCCVFYYRLTSPFELRLRNHRVGKHLAVTLEDVIQAE